MAAHEFELSTASIALTGGAATTVLQVVAAANIRVRIMAFGVAFNGATSTSVPALVELVRQSTAGTTSALTPTKKDDSIAETLQSTARHTATVEPTTGDTLKAINVPTYMGRYEWHAPSRERAIICGGGDRVGIRINAPANVSVVAWMECEE